MGDPILIEIDSTLASEILRRGDAVEVTDEHGTYLDPTPQLYAWLADWLDRKANGLPLTRNWWRW